MEHSPLNRLSAELRNHIWQLVVSFEDSLLIKANASLNARQHPLTRTCRQIRNETIAMFYAHNKFMGTFALQRLPGNYGHTRIAGKDLDVLLAWLECLSTARHDLISRLNIRIEGEIAGNPSFHTKCRMAELSKVLVRCGYVQRRLAFVGPWPAMCGWMYAKPQQRSLRDLLADCGVEVTATDGQTLTNAILEY
jgi:hypothetical protein